MNALVRKKTPALEAIQWNKDGDHPAVTLQNGTQSWITGKYAVETQKGWKVVHPGDWILKGKWGENILITAAEFAADYEMVP